MARRARDAAKRSRAQSPHPASDPVRRPCRKAGLLELEPNAFYGAVLSLRDRDDDAEQIREWAALGGRAFTREARAEDEAKKPVVISFPAPVARGVAAALRGAGLRFKLARGMERSRRFRQSRDHRKRPPRHNPQGRDNGYGNCRSIDTAGAPPEACECRLSLSLRAAKLKRHAASARPRATL